MTWTFTVRGKPFTLTPAVGAVAVRPTDDARSRTGSRARLVSLFGESALDSASGGRFGLHPGAGNRLTFERAGWLIVEPTTTVARAAPITRSRLDDANHVQQVYLDPSGNIRVTTDVLTVQLDPGASSAAAQARIADDELVLVRQLTFAPNTFEVRAARSTPLVELVASLQAKRHYRFAEPMLLQAMTGRFTPADPRFTSQWHHDNDGSNGGVAGADIRSREAWALTRGQGVRIAVIDNGMQVRHPDLKAGIVGGGYFTSEESGSAVLTPYEAGQTGFPSTQHGTFCLGMAGARANNRRGGCGSAPEADLLPIACAKDQIGTQATLARAVAFAADPSRELPGRAASDGAHVIACSLGPNGADWELTSVLDLAIGFAARRARGGKGVPIFWAVSNGFVEVSRDQVCSHPDVIAVGSSNRNDRSGGSAYGPKLEFVAPGDEVFSTQPAGQYGFDTGSSFAAPLAAGVAALVLARHPRWTRQQVRKRLRDSCDKVGGLDYDARGRNNVYGYGRINAAKAAQ